MNSSSKFSNLLSNSNFDWKIGGDSKGTAMVIAGIILFIIIIGVIFYYSIKNTKDNGGSTAQAFIGKKTGSFCTNDAMCASNKCNKYNICDL
jgi:uncharacterized protein YpmB